MTARWAASSRGSPQNAGSPSQCSPMALLGCFPELSGHFAGRLAATLVALRANCISTATEGRADTEAANELAFPKSRPADLVGLPLCRDSGSRGTGCRQVFDLPTASPQLPQELTCGAWQLRARRHRPKTGRHRAFVSNPCRTALPRAALFWLAGGALQGLLRLSLTMLARDQRPSACHRLIHLQQARVGLK